MKRGAPAQTIDGYLATLPKDQRTALERLRKIIRAAAPETTEVISYQIPAYKQNGLLVGFAAAENHCTFHVIPAVLVRKLVKARIAENARALDERRHQR